MVGYGHLNWLITKTHACKTDIITGASTCEHVVRKTSCQDTPWKNSVAERKPIERHFSGWSSRLHETEGERILIHGSHNRN